MLAPLLLLLLLEAGLRLGGYGYPTSFLLPVKSGTVYTDNEKFAWQFYSPDTALRPNPFMVSAVKPSQAIRICILGESAAAGTPDPSFGFGRILEVMLRRQFPQKHIEVINAAMRGINSHIVLPIARDCARLKPDLFIVYMGNNEVVGLHAPGPKSGYLTPHRSLLRLVQWCKATRLGQLTSPALQQWGLLGGHPKGEQQDMAFFRERRLAMDDPRRRAVYDNFRANLQDLCQVIGNSGAKLVLSTVAVNLKDFPPFASVHSPNLSPQWETIYAAGIEAEAKGHIDAAIAHYQQAAALDPHYAELQFRLGRACLAAGRFKLARSYFQSARDWDALQFRADTRINELIRQVAAAAPNRGVTLLEADQLVAESELSEHQIPGDQLFYEHVHFRFAGDYLMARLLDEAVIKSLPEKLGTAPGATQPLPSLNECAEALAFTAPDELQLSLAMSQLTAQPPFLDQFEHVQRQARIKAELKERAAKMGQAEAQQGLEWYHQAIAQRPDDWQLYYNLGKFHHLLNHHAAETAEYEKALARLPHSQFLRLTLADALARAGQTEASMGQLKEAIKRDRHCQPAIRALAALAGKAR